MCGEGESHKKCTRPHILTNIFLEPNANQCVHVCTAPHDNEMLLAAICTCRTATDSYSGPVISMIFMSG